jgi:hypothetical protein
MSDECILICPHCGNETPHTIKARVTSEADAYDSDGEFLFTYEDYYYLTCCGTCKGVSIYTDWEMSDKAGELKSANLLYPHEPKLDQTIPEIVKKSFEEARRVERISPNAFAVLIRRSLELLCKDQNAKGTNLKDQISDLSNRGVIPQTLMKMANTLRFVGNLGAHEIDFDFERQETQAMEDFLLAMLEYVYVAPSRIKSLEVSISKKTKK